MDNHEECNFLAKNKTIKLNPVCTFCCNLYPKTLTVFGILFSVQSFVTFNRPVSPIPSILIYFNSVCIIVFLLTCGLLLFSWVLKFFYICNKEDQKLNKKEKQDHGPICGFCNKWSPRTLMLMGVWGILFYLFLIIGTIAFTTGVFSDAINKIPIAFLTLENQIRICMSAVALIFVVFTFLLKLTRANI